MQRKVLRLIVFWAICCGSLSHHVFAQKISFGVITGAQLTDDYRTLVCLPLRGGQLPSPGCPPLAYGLAIGLSNASRALIFGPKVNLQFSPSFSLEVDALHRKIRTNTTFATCSAQEPPDCAPAPFLSPGTETQFTWEFPVLAKYQMSGRKVNPFIEGGPSFRPAENREQYGITAGGGVEIRMRSLRFSPGLRYSRWGLHGKNVSANQNQLQLVVGIDRPSATESISVFGRKISLAAVAGYALTGGLRTQTRAVNHEVVNPATGRLTPSEGKSTENKNRTSPVIGVAAEIALTKDFSIELVGLYRPLNAVDTSVYDVGFTKRNVFTVLTWEFPLLAKYRLPSSGAKPFFEIGPSFRASGNLNETEPSLFGVTGGAGVEFPKSRLAISPTLRFTHWAPDQARHGMSLRRNQVELVIAVRF
jgi:hypothetical protein